MASLEQQIAEDNAAIEEYRAKFGDEKAAEFAAQLYILRRTPPPVAASNTGGWSGLPRWLIIMIAVWVGLLETADKLPQLLLAIPQYQATLAEYHAKLLQPDLVTAQLEKAKADARTAAIQPDLTAVQLDKTKLETKAAAFQPDTAAAQLEKAKADAKTAAIQPDLTAVQLGKLRLETKAAIFAPDTASAQLDKTREEAKAARFQPALTAAQAFKTETEADANGAIMADPNSSARLGTMFDLIDPNHPHLMSRGLISPNVQALVLDVLKDNPHAFDKNGSTPEPTPTPTPTPTYSAPETPKPSPTSTPSVEPTPTPSPTAEAKAPTTYDNYDFDGNDLEHMASDSIESCLSTCRGNSECKGVTFDKWNKICFLKSEAKMLWFDPHGIAAPLDPDAKPSYSDAPMYMTRFPAKGFHRTGEMSYAANSATCERTCKQTDWCVAESFFKSDSMCMMLRTTDAYISNSDAESSIKRQKPR